MNLDVPIYFSAGMTERATEFYKLFISWTNENVKQTFVERNMFDFKHIRPFEQAMADQPGPMVLFATPGMLHAGTSLDVFKKWAPSPKNLVIIPGYVAATWAAQMRRAAHTNFRIAIVSSELSATAYCRAQSACKLTHVPH